MFKIQTLNSISEIGLQQFSLDLYEVSPNIETPDAILVRSRNLHDTFIHSSVKAIGRAGAGTNNIPIEPLTQRGIPVFNTPGANANAVRELVIAGMLLASRHLCRAWYYVKHLEKSGAELEKEIEQNKKQFVGSELMGKTLGIIGLGSVGVKVANAAIHLGMHVIGYDPTISVGRAWELSANVEQAHTLDELLIKSDFVSFHVPLTNETQHMIKQSHFNLMKKGSVLLNFAREGIIDHQALTDAIHEEKLAAYVSDFPSMPLKNHPHVISLPHLGASTKEAEENCAIMLTKQIRDFLETGAIKHAVNFPNVETLPLRSGTRLSIVNANIPNMVAQISAKLAAVGLNITSLSNKSRDKIAYTLIDVDTEVNDFILQAISTIEGIIQIRRILPLANYIQTFKFAHNNLETEQCHPLPNIPRSVLLS